MNTQRNIQTLYSNLIKSLIHSPKALTRDPTESRIQISNKMIRTTEPLKFSLDSLLYSLLGLKTKTSHSIEINASFTLYKGCLTISSHNQNNAVKIEDLSLQKKTVDFDSIEPLELRNITFRCGAGLIYQLKESHSNLRFSCKKELNEGDGKKNRGSVEEMEEEELTMIFRVMSRADKDFPKNSNLAKKSLEVSFSVDEEKFVWVEGELRIEDIFEVKDFLKKFYFKKEVNVFKTRKSHARIGRQEGFDKVKFNFDFDKIHLKMKTIPKEEKNSSQYFIEWVFYEVKLEMTPKLLNPDNYDLEYNFESECAMACLINSEMPPADPKKLLQFEKIKIKKFQKINSFSSKFSISGERLRIGIDNIIMLNQDFNHDKGDTFNLVHLLWITPSAIAAFDKDDIKFQTVDLYSNKNQNLSFVQIKGLENSGRNYGFLEAESITWFSKNKKVIEGSQKLIKGTSKFDKILMKFGQGKY